MLSQYKYSGVDKSGRPTRGVAEGASPLDIVAQLRDSGVKVYSLQKKISLLPEGLSTRKIHPSELAIFNEQLAHLLKTKLPLSESLRHISKEMKHPRLKRISEDISGRLEKGGTFSDSLAAHKGYLPPLYLSMVAAGEKTGNLAEVLFQVANYFRFTGEMRKRILNITVYPLMVAFLSIAVLVFLIKVMVPPYVEMYSGFHVQFPLVLRAVVFAESLLRPKIIAPAAVLTCVAGITAFFFFRGKREEFFAAIDPMLLKLPLWGQMVKEGLLARNLATIAVLLRSGVPLHESLRLTENLTSVRPVRDLFKSVADDALEGQSLSESLVRRPFFPLEIAWVIRNGEFGGNLVEALENAAQMCHGKFEFSSRMILSVLEPALLIAMGLVVVAIAVSLFYPLYSISKYLGV